jgi:hypothetical protein
MNPTLGTVNSTVNYQTVFIASSSIWGTTRVTASYNLLSNTTGLITIDPPSIDSIIIRSGPNGTGNWIGNNNYIIGDQDTFYCAGYNTTLSIFISDVSANWGSFSPSVGSITSPGSPVIFRALKEGTTWVTAAFGSFSNNTGILTVSAPPTPSKLDLTCQIRTDPVGPLLEDTPLDIIVTVENLGPDTASNVTVHFLVQYQFTAPYVIESNDTIITLASLEKVDLIHPNSSVPRGIYNLSAFVDPNAQISETDETNNRADLLVKVVPLSEFVVTINVDPATVTITADDNIQFNATGIGTNDQNYSIQPTWSENGGGDIFSSGLFIAIDVGNWEVYADFGGIRGVAKVTITPGKLKALVITDKKIAFEVNESYQFKVKGYDSDGNEIIIKPGSVEWYVNGTVGVIDINSGNFTATQAGVGRVGASIFSDGQWLSTETDVVVKLFIIVEKRYIVTTDNAKLNVQVAFTGEGNATVENLTADRLADENITQGSFGENLRHIGVFIKIEIPDEDKWDWIIIEVEYDPAKLPENVNENDLVLFYFSEAQNKWVKIENSWVVPDENKVYANVTHLTIFAPMAESGGVTDGPGEDEDTGESPLGMSLMVILALVVVVIIIAIAAGLIILRRRKPLEEAREEGKKEEREDETKEKELVEDERIDWGDEDEEAVPIDLSKLELITKKCPKCRAEIEVEPTFDDRVHLECRECGKKGQLPNPYLDEISRLKESKKIITKPREEDEELIEIECRKCGEPIEIHYSEESKVHVKCGDCGAKGAIKNPYLKVEKEKDERSMEKPKPPKDRKPSKAEEEEVDFDFTKEDEEIEEEDLITVDDDDDDVDFDLT